MKYFVKYIVIIIVIFFSSLYCIGFPIATNSKPANSNILYIPPEYGYIRSIWIPDHSDEAIVFLIEDVDPVSLAQENIDYILKHLIDEYGLATICIEEARFSSITRNKELDFNIYEIGGDKVLVNSLINKLTAKQIEKIAMVVKGIHTIEIQKILRENKVSYLVITPRIKDKSANHSSSFSD